MATRFPLQDGSLPHLDAGNLGRADPYPFHPGAGTCSRPGCLWALILSVNLIKWRTGKALLLGGSVRLFLKEIVVGWWPEEVRPASTMQDAGCSDGTGKKEETFWLLLLEWCSFSPAAAKHQTSGCLPFGLWDLHQWPSRGSETFGHGLGPPWF